jgi:hypothetical protein
MTGATWDVFLSCPVMYRTVVSVAVSVLVCDYTSDPAPLVADGKLYIITGRDTAGPRVNDFRMPDGELLIALP